MSLQRAKQEAQRMADKHSKLMFVVWDTTDGDYEHDDSYQVCSEEALEHFYLGLEPIYFASPALR